MKRSDSPVIVVSGDICLDVLGYPITPSPKNATTLDENWRQAGEIRTFYRRGGVWLLADFLKAALKPTNCCTIVEPVLGKSEVDFERLTRQQIVHSLLGLNVFADKIRNKENCECEVLRVRVAQTHGFSGPDRRNGPTKHPPLEVKLRGDVANPDLVILDDTGNRFRYQGEPWPEAIVRDTDPASLRPLVLYKLHRPLPNPPLPNVPIINELWQRIRSVHGNNTVVVVSADDLREAGAVISRKLSWERTALELVWQLNGGSGSDRLAELRQCPHLIVRLGLEGAVYWCNPGNDQNPRAWLVYHPNAIEGDWNDQHAGSMVGYGSAFIAGLAASLLAPESKREFQRLRDGSALAKGTVASAGGLLSASLPQLERGIKRGLLASRHLLSIGYGTPPKGQDPDPTYLVEQVFAAFSDKDEAAFATASIPISSDLFNPDPDRWSILNSRLPGGSDLDTAAEALSTWKTPTDHPQVGGILTAIPRADFGKLITYDRNEIEAYRAVSNVVREYLVQPAPKRPLCLAVFGPPGSGKSFGVEEVAVGIARQSGARIVKLTFNLSQFSGVDELNRSLHLVRDAVLKGSVPLVFFDEFDSSVGVTERYWLKLLLAPMQDGEFLDQGALHPLGRAIFVFAGGTSHTYAKFVPSQHGPDGLVTHEWKRFESAKGPDFISRLRGVLDIPGIEIDPSSYRAAPSLRRAGVLRFQLWEKAKHLFDSGGRLQIDEGVLRAFLQVRRFHHGIRSLEAIIDMSQLGNRTRFDAGSLPHPSQMTLHVECLTDLTALDNRGPGFIDLVHRPSPFPLDRRDKIAREIHTHYLEERMKPGGGYNPAKASHQEWDHPLNEFYRDSNRTQADDIPRKLHLIGYRYIDPSPSGSASATASAIKELPDEAIDRLAKPEHDRWCAEMRVQGWTHGEVHDLVRRNHPSLTDWEELDNKEKEKDRAAIRAIPRYLEAGGYIVVR